jgi:hypothetical protein
VIGKLEGAAALVAIAIAIALGVYVYRKGPGNVAKALVGAAEDVAVGTVTGIGKVIGIPETNADQCQIDINNGDWYAASRSCPAGTYLAAVQKSVASPFTAPRAPETPPALGDWNTGLPM